MEKKKRPVWLIELLGAVICFVLVLPFGELSQLNEDSTILAMPMIIVLLGFWGFLISLIVHGIKALIRLSTRKHVDPSVRTYQKIRSGALVDGKTDGFSGGRGQYTYNRDEGDFRFAGAQESLSWGIVFLMMVLMYPIGFYYMVVKTTQERGRYYRNGATIQFVGGIFFLLFTGLLIMTVRTGVDNQEFMRSMFGIFGIPAGACLLLLIYGTWLRIRGSMYDRYRTLITVEGVTDLDEIAKREGTTFARAAERVEWLIDSGLLGNAYLSYIDREVIVPGISKKIVRRCRNCGGTTVLMSTDPQICDFCGGAL